MKFDAVIFDLDGTLVETIGLYEQALIGAFQEFGGAMTSENYLHSYQSGKHMRDLMSDFAIDASKEHLLRERRDMLYIDLLREKTVWLDGAESLLQKTKKYPRAIVTGSWRSYVEAINDSLDLLTQISTVITADQIHAKMKPDPYGLLLAAEMLGVDPAKSIYVGDQSFDIEAAQRAGMKSAFIQSRFSPKTLQMKPDITVSTLSELEKFL